MFEWIRRFNRTADPEVVVVLPEPLAGEVLNLLLHDRRIEAIKLTRKLTGLTLLPAVKAVDELALAGPT
jgi:hypothetical protein